MVTARLGEQQVPLSPETFTGDNVKEALSKLGIDEKEFRYSYMPDGSMLVNSSYFDANRLQKVGTKEDGSLSEFVAVPNSYITGIQYMCNCSKSGLTTDFEKCRPWDLDGDKSLSAGAIAGIAVGCVAAVGGIVAGIFVWLMKKKESTSQEECAA